MTDRLAIVEPLDRFLGGLAAMKRVVAEMELPADEVDQWRQLVATSEKLVVASILSIFQLLERKSADIHERVLS